MAEQDTPASGTPAVEPEAAAGAPGPTLEPEAASSSNTDAFEEHPELFVGAAFVGGIVVAQLLKRIGQ
jgi:hypothetical protein